MDVRKHRASPAVSHRTDPAERFHTDGSEPQRSSEIYEEERKSYRFEIEMTRRSQVRMPPPGVCLNIESERNLRDGRGSLTSPDRFLGQDFSDLKHYCLKERLRFVDSSFPPDIRSIGVGLLKPEDEKSVVWRRPAELVSNPVYIVEETSRFDFLQGDVGNCWFLASVGALTFQKEIMKQIIQSDQRFSVDYAGIFHFRFWRFGKWVDVVIDDKLPTINGELIFVRSKTPDEFWPALLEKAYAKVCGSYMDMNSGNISEALKDFTGGPHVTFKLSEASEKLWDIMRRASQSESLMGCSTPGGQNKDKTFVQVRNNLRKVISNVVLPNGLVNMHAYTVTGITEVVCRGRPLKLVRIFNPWGRGEWNGDWSDRSPLWNLVGPEEQNYNIVRDNGEFWMSMEDFCGHFSEVDVCCSDMNVLAGSHNSSWRTEGHSGQWVMETTAGGCPNYPDTFPKNPQYRVTLQTTPEDPRDTNTPNLLVSLLQKPLRAHRHLADHLHIGFNIYEVPAHLKDLREKLPASFFNTARPVGHVKNFLNAREVTEFFRLKAGDYVIIPSTFQPNEASSFILSIYSETEARIEDMSGYGLTRRKINTRNVDESFQLFQQYADKYREVDSEQLQRLLNENLPARFGLDLCKSVVALMDLSVTGRLNESEFLRLWKRVVMLKDMFNNMDDTNTGSLSMNKLQNALQVAGFGMSDSMLNLMAMRYGYANGQITLENYIFLVLRMESMSKTFKRLAAGEKGVMLQENEWMHLTMYS